MVRNSRLLGALVGLILGFGVSVLAQSWTAPRTWVAGELVSPSIMNSAVRDNLIVLRAGGIAMSSQAANDLVYASSSTQFARIAGAANRVLVTNGSSVPSLGATLPNAVQDNITRTGTVTSGTWSGSFGAVSGANLTGILEANIADGSLLARYAEAGSWTGGNHTFTHETANYFTFNDTTDSTAGYIGVSPHFITGGTTDRLGLSGVAGIDFSGDNGTSVGMSLSNAGALDVAAGITAGSGNVGIVDGTGKIPAISSTYFASLSGANLTGIPNSATTATALNTGSAIVARDGSGDFTAGTISAALIGNASTATALQNARTIGGVSFNGTANIVPTTITVADTTDSTSFVGLWESATGDLLPKTDAALTYNASTGAVVMAGMTTHIVGGGAVDGDLVKALRNTSTGASARAYVELTAGTASSFLFGYGSGNTGLTGIAGSAVLYNDTVGGIALYAANASGPVRIYGGNVLSLSATSTAITNALRYNSATLQPGFLAYNSADDALSVSATVDFDTEVYDEAGNFAADTFTAPVTGRYLLCTTVRLVNDSGSAASYSVSIITSNRNYNNIAQSPNLANGGDDTIGNCVIADMDASDTAHVTASVGTTGVIKGVAAPTTTFSGRLVP